MELPDNILVFRVMQNFKDAVELTHLNSVLLIIICSSAYQ